MRSGETRTELQGETQIKRLENRLRRKRRRNIRLRKERFRDVESREIDSEIQTGREQGLRCRDSDVEI